MYLSPVIGLDQPMSIKSTWQRWPTRCDRIIFSGSRFDFLEILSLKITQEEVDKGIDYIEFYNHFKEVIEKYNPAIIVWGRNDFLALRESYKYNKVPSLKKKTRYINLLKLHKNYFNLKNDLGLFNALNLYTVREDKQAHNALDDAQVTREIFNGFKKAINYNFHPDLSKYQ